MSPDADSTWGVPFSDIVLRLTTYGYRSVCPTLESLSSDGRPTYTPEGPPPLDLDPGRPTRFERFVFGGSRRGPPQSKSTGEDQGGQWDGSSLVPTGGSRVLPTTTRP